MKTTKARAKQPNTVGVVIGRFEVPELHSGHRYLLDRANAATSHLLILLGVSGGSPSSIDPLDFLTRKIMLAGEYPEATIVPLLDTSTNEIWSRNLDDVIKENFPNHKAILFGSRDSFLPYYFGDNAKKYATPKGKLISGTRLRAEVSGKPLDSKEFRIGAIYAATKQTYPTSFQTVDVAIRHKTEAKVLVGRKPGESVWRFPGGFVDPTDESLEAAAKREAGEEVGGAVIDEVTYLGSFRINDHRYRKSEHKILTALFSAEYVSGEIKASDDLEEVRWQDFDGLVDCLIPSHKHLGETFLKSVGK